MTEITVGVVDRVDETEQLLPSRLAIGRREGYMFLEVEGDGYAARYIMTPETAGYLREALDSLL